MNYLAGKKILVTGCCGSVGAELVDTLLGDPQYAPEEVICIDNNESALFFQEQRHLADSRARFFVCDVRDIDALRRHMRQIQVVFHLAALKHVVLCERSPLDAIQTNIHGVQNVITAATDNEVEKVIYTSSDKAVNPTSVMGTSKLMGERLMTAANSTRRGQQPVFASTRFGNVLGSRGSVVPIFLRQIAKGGPVTLTDDGMTRFVMTVKQAVSLVLASAAIARGGEVFVTKMPVINIRDLAEAMIERVAPGYGYRPDAVSITRIGTKPGEKMYEELMSGEETRRSVELQHYFAVLPAFRGLYQGIRYDYSDLIRETVENPYISSVEAVMSQQQLIEFLERHGLLSTDAIASEHPDRRYWPGEKEEN